MSSALLAALLPLVSIASPTPGQTVTGSKVPVSLAVVNFALVDYRTHPLLVPGQGHVHLWLDQTDLSKISAVKATSNTYTFENVKPGNHTLVAELVNNDHSSLQPPVTTAVSFTTSAPGPSPVTPLLTSSLLASALLLIALYLVSQKTRVTKAPRSYKRPPKSSHKQPRRHARK